jgi:hypothetical protein
MIPLAALLLVQASPALPTPAQGPIEMFRAACTQGTLTLSRKTASAIRYDSLPTGARLALGQTLAAPGETHFTTSPKSAEVPGSVYALGTGGEAYLILPASSEAAHGSFAHSCSVIWKGEHFLEARNAILPDPPALLAGQDPASNSDGHAFIGTIAGDIYLSATTLRGWTVIKSVPRSDAPIP